MGGQVTEDFNKYFTDVERTDHGSDLHDQRVLRQGSEHELQRWRDQLEEGPEGLLPSGQGRRWRNLWLPRQYVDVEYEMEGSPSL